ncbi:MAG: VOC family protein [Acidobacteria bacterium]|nr:VOC family protein [Acidobacteriota bacterium]
MTAGRRLVTLVVFAVAVLGVCAPARAQLTEPFDHLHLAVTDVERARDWYIRHMGGNEGETSETVAWGKWPVDHPLPIQLHFMLSSDARPSAGSAIDHLGFSFADLDATVRALQAAGVKIVRPVEEVPGLWKRAVVEDPWGATLELVQDPDALGLHHVELRVPDPDQALRWYVKAFGGDRTKYKGQIDAVRYRELGVFFLFAVRDEHAAPATGHAIDHISFGPIDLDKVVSALTADSATFTSNPNPRINPGCRLVQTDGENGPGGIRRLYCAQPDQLSHRVVYLDGPGGVRIELVQHLEAGGH